MNKSEIASKLGVSRDTVYEWEKKGVLGEKMKEKGVREEARDREAEHKKFLEKLAKEFPDIPMISAKHIPPCEFVPTGFQRLDDILGGGWARGRIIYGFGRFAVGKTTLAMTAVREFQKVGNVAYLDVEHAVDEKYTRALGVDMDKLEFHQPVYLDDAITLAQRLVESNLYSLVVIDSIAAGRYRPEQEGEVGDAHMGWRGRIMNQAMRLLNAECYRNGTSVLIINQTRDVPKVGGSGAEVKYQPGGTPIEFACSQMLELRAKTNALEKSKDGRPIKISCFKNKVGMPFRNGIFQLTHGKGFEDTGEVE